LATNPAKNIQEINIMTTISRQSLRNQRGINWRELWCAYRVFMPNPAQGILHILEAGRYSRWQRMVITRLSRQAVAIHNWVVVVDLAELIELPPDTLGGAYARHMFEQGFTPDTFINQELDKDPFEHRLAIAHDVQHIITGFDSSPLGEFGLAAFMFVQYWDLLNLFVLSWTAWFAIGNWKSIPQLIANLARGFSSGWRSRPLVAYPYECNWHKSIAQVRQELRIADVR
jgi:ubiquinone biosynthesis protein Coq4